MDIFSHIYLYLMNSKVNKISNIKIYESHYTVQWSISPHNSNVLLLLTFFIISFIIIVNIFFMWIFMFVIYTNIYIIY